MSIECSAEQELLKSTEPLTERVRYESQRPSHMTNERAPLWCPLSAHRQEEVSDLLESWIDVLGKGYRLREPIPPRRTALDKVMLAVHLALVGE